MKERMQNLLIGLGLVAEDFDPEEEFVYSISLVQEDKVIASVDGLVLSVEQNFTSVDLVAAGEQVYKIKINDVYWKDLSVFFVK